MRTRWLEDLLRGRRRGPALWLFRAVLAPFAVAFRAATTARARAYATGRQSVSTLPVPVISVGNLSVGGTGKTPFVRWLATEVCRRGGTPLVLGRGYGARAAGSELDEEGAALAAAVPNAIIRQGRDRLRVARGALASAGAINLIILDDGAQRLSIARDLDIWLLDASDPFEGGWTLPAGGLREAPHALRRADLCVLTRCERTRPSELAKSCNEVRKRTTAQCELLRAIHRIQHQVLNSDKPLSAWAGHHVWLTAGIADPSSFASEAHRLGLVVCGQIWFPDHHAFLERDLIRIERAARRAGAEAVLCTSKDWPKVQPRLEAREPALPWIATDVEVEFAPEDRARILARIDELLRPGVRSARHPRKEPVA